MRKLKLPIFIIGGGPAGCFCAKQLASQGLEVFLIVKNGSHTLRIGETCGPEALRLIEEKFGAIPFSIYQPFKTFFSAWNSAQLDSKRISFWQAGDGAVLDRVAFDRWLLDSTEDAGVTVLRNYKVINCSWNEKNWQLTTANHTNKQIFSAEFVVEATGRASRSVAQPNAKRFYTDKLICLSIKLHKKSDTYFTPLVESCPIGWWYTAQLVSGENIISLFTDVDILEPAENRLTWLNKVLKTTSYVRQIAGHLPDNTSMSTRDARTSIRNVLWRNSWICVGDAARTLDPLSGNGIERAIQDGLNAAEVVSKAVTNRNFDELKSLAVNQVGSFHQALALQEYYYGLERRWSKEQFWSRRAANRNRLTKY